MSEQSRLASLRSVGILDTASEEAFDRLVQLAAEALQAPIALASLVDEARLWIKAKVGIDQTEMPRTGSFCSHTIQGNGVLVVEDAQLDGRFASSPHVVENGMRFYAGAPVSLSTGDVVGALCVLDRVPREAPSQNATALLQGLAAAAGHLLDLRRELVARREAERQLAEHARLLGLAEEMAGIGTWRLDFGTGALHLSASIFEIYGLAACEPAPDVDTLLAMYDPTDRSRIVESIERARVSGEGYDFDARLRQLNGAVRDVRCKARVECDGNGKPALLIGVFQDVTVEKRAMMALESERVEADRRANRLRHLASVDILTGLPNRRAFLEQADLALRRGTAVSLAILDIDYFKSINDRYGHDGGDMALAAFGRICARFAHRVTCLGRIGGEEFAILIEGMDRKASATLIEAIRSAVASEHLLLQRGVELHLTFSAGLAHANASDDWLALFSRADQALYRAKHDGRDRLAIAA